MVDAEHSLDVMRCNVKDCEEEHSIRDLTVEPLRLVERQPSRHSERDLHLEIPILSIGDRSRVLVEHHRLAST